MGAQGGIKPYEVRGRQRMGFLFFLRSHSENQQNLVKVKFSLPSGLWHATSSLFSWALDGGIPLKRMPEWRRNGDLTFPLAHWAEEINVNLSNRLRLAYLEPVLASSWSPTRLALSFWEGQHSLQLFSKTWGGRDGVWDKRPFVPLWSSFTRKGPSATASTASPTAALSWPFLASQFRAHFSICCNDCPWFP